MTPVQKSGVAELASSFHNALSSVTEAYGRLLQAALSENEQLRIQLAIAQVPKPVVEAKCRVCEKPLSFESFQCAGCADEKGP
jgi:DNA repair exonuclease SbcCD ATPase subunit